MERVGRHDSFFDLGGHSLLLTSLSSRIVDLFNVEIPFEDLFMASSLYELSILVDEERLSKFNTEDIEIIEQDLMSLSEEDLRRILDKE